MINWGIVGYGRMGKTFENCFKDPSQDFKLGAIASKSNSHQNKKIKIFQQYDDLINLSEIEAVYISTLNNTHKNLIKKCIEQNKKILCEKPLGLNSNEVKEIYNLINKKKYYFFEAIAFIIC